MRGLCVRLFSGSLSDFAHFLRLENRVNEFCENVFIYSEAITLCHAMNIRTSYAAIK